MIDQREIERQAEKELADSGHQKINFPKIFYSMKKKDHDWLLRTLFPDPKKNKGSGGDG